jgi:hypothetical protein
MSQISCVKCHVSNIQRQVLSVGVSCQVLSGMSRASCVKCHASSDM